MFSSLCYLLLFPFTLVPIQSNLTHSLLSISFLGFLRVAFCISKRLQSLTSLCLCPLSHLFYFIPTLIMFKDEGVIISHSQSYCSCIKREVEREGEYFLILTLLPSSLCLIFLCFMPRRHTVIGLFYFSCLSPSHKQRVFYFRWIKRMVIFNLSLVTATRRYLFILRESDIVRVWCVSMKLSVF